MKILVLGSKGQLGRCLLDQLEKTDFEVIYTSRLQIDITDFIVTKNKILEIVPGIIINVAAFTAVDSAEDKEDQANLINHLAVKNIAVICHQINCWLIHVSTDYVFDGGSNIPYKEWNQTNPKSVYGATKLEGELAIQSSGCNHIIIRTAWVFSEYGNNFLKTMLKLGSEKNELSIVSDQVGAPTYAQDIAKVIKIIVLKIIMRKALSGIYHFCGDKSCSWYEFAKKIFEQAKIKGMDHPDKLNAILSDSYITKALRPSYSVLDCSKLEYEFMVQASDWHHGIISAINKIKKSREL